MGIQRTRLVRPLIAAALGGCCGCLLALLPLLRTAPSAPVIAFVPRTSGTNFTEDMHRGAQAAAEKAGYRIYWNAPTREDDVDRQIGIAENAVRRGARALILGPANIWGVTTMVNDLIARRVPVVFVQTGPAEPTGPYLTSITPDQTQFGRLAAARAAVVTGGSGQVAIVGIDRGTPETLLRADSFNRAIASYPNIQVVAQSPGAVQTMEAEQSTRELVSAYPQLKAIFAVSADATQGAMLALQDVDARHAISLIGSDRDLFLAANLREKKLDSLVSLDGYRIGYLAVQAALVGIAGRPLPPSLHVGVQLLTPTNLVFNGNH
ncbi:MAG TPA: substrate-binding domain-containing protein [Acidobacteriaceae bacterium]|nr:substrate-binding domain-containing protein [Acidobacteriaceae bacterium]